MLKPTPDISNTIVLVHKTISYTLTLSYTRISVTSFIKLSLSRVSNSSTIYFAYVKKLRHLLWIVHVNEKTFDLYSGIFQIQSSGCASGVDLFRNFTKLKILNIWIVKYLLNCKRYLSYNFRIFQKISECWVLENLDVHLERTTWLIILKS